MIGLIYHPTIVGIIVRRKAITAQQHALNVVANKEIVKIGATVAMDVKYSRPFCVLSVCIHVFFGRHCFFLLCYASASSTRSMVKITG